MGDERGAPVEVKFGLTTNDEMCTLTAICDGE
jgi:hypothetical protein